MALYNNLLKELQSKRQSNNVQSSNFNTNKKVTANTSVSSNNSSASDNLYNDLLGRLQKKRQAENEQKEAQRKAEEESKVKETQKEESKQAIAPIKQSVTTENTLRATGDKAKVPIASNLKVANSENGISNKIENVEKVDMNKGATASEDVNSDEAKKRIPAQVRYVLDSTKQAVKDYGNKWLQYFLTANASNNDKYAKTANNLLGQSNEALEKENKNYTEKIKELNSSQNATQIKSEGLPSGLKTAGAVGQSIGNMLPSIGLSLVPGIGSALSSASVFATSSGGSSAEALEEGYNIKQAKTVGDLKGFVEAGIEKLSGGVKIGGKGALDDIVGNAIASKVKSRIGNTLLTKGYQLGGEVVEENLTNLAGYAIDKMVLDKGIPDLKTALNDAEETTKTTFLTTLALNLVGLGGSNTSVIQEIENTTGQKLNSTQKQKIEQTLQEVQNESKNVLQSNQDMQLQNQTNPIPPIANNIQEDVQQNNVIPPINNINDINEFNGYTQQEKNNIQSNKIKIAESNEDIINFIKVSMNVPSNLKMYLGKVKENISSKIRESLGINVNNYNISLKTDSIRKIFKDHGDIITESSRGQVPITESDFLNIPNIINNPDTVNKSGETQQGKPVIKFEKNIDGNTVVVTYVSDKHNNLELQTMYKFKNNKKTDSATATNELNSLARTSETISGTNLINNSIPQNEQNMQVSNANIAVSPIAQNIEPETPITPINQDLKQRKHYKSIIQSQYASDEARSVAKSLMGLDTYMPESNNKQLERADTRISISGTDSELNSLIARATTGGNIKADDIAVGERLIQYYSKIGDKEKLQDAIQATAMAGTTAGQTVQAMSLLNHQTPEGQAIWLQRSVEKMNNDLKKSRGEKADQFELTGEMLDKIVNSNNSEELQANLDDVYKELGQQVSKSTMEKIDSWRYFSMLANPRTHIRNIVGNLAMGQTQQVKNKVTGVIEAVVSKVNPDMERTHTIIPASKEVKEFAKTDIINVADRLGLNENKYNPKSRLQSNMRTFKSDAMENTLGKLFNLNDTALEAEDGWGLKAGYKKALSEYMTANKLEPDTITDAQLAKARNYAVEQAKEATFHQESKMASLINQLSNRNKFAKYGTDAVLPFVKTPINVAKAGMNYSPAGLIKSMIVDTVRLRKGNITVNQYIDNISKGLTGTGIALVGYVLADCGILKASGSDDKDKENYDEQNGKQTYSIQIGDNTYSLDWLAPTGIPLFIGAEISEMAQAKKKEKTSSSTDENSGYSQVLQSGTNLLNALANSMNPMTEMSMLSGLTSALSSYEQGSSQILSSMGTNAAKSYINQFIPTALGQIAKTTDKYERSTTSTKTGTLPKAIDSTKNQIMNKIPGLRQMLPVKTDIWGNDMKQADNIVQRGLENAVLPWTRKNVSSSKVDKALTDLYDKIGESSILPDTLNKKFTINSKNYQLTNEEYSKYKKAYGQTSYKLIENLVGSKEYNTMNDKQKQKAIEEIYSYAKEANKVDYAKNIKQTIKTTITYNTLEALKKEGGNQSQYLSYIAKTEGVDKDKEKAKILVDSNYTNKTKSIIYKNTLGKEDDFYIDVLAPKNFNINEYLKYKSQTFESKKDSNGKTISGSKKKAVASYINSLKLNPTEKAILFAKTGYADKSYKQSVYQYINSLDLTAKRKQEIWDSLGY